jgi:hypothetical protein
MLQCVCVTCVAPETTDTHHILLLPAGQLAAFADVQKTHHQLSAADLHQPAAAQLHTEHSHRCAAGSGQGILLCTYPEIRISLQCGSSLKLHGCFELGMVGAVSTSVAHATLLVQYYHVPMETEA